MFVDCGSRTLANRQTAVDMARAVKDDLKRSGERSVILNLGDSLATASWLDGFLGYLLDAKIKPYIVVVSEFEDTREHVRLCLRSRESAVLCARNMAALTAGEVSIEGYVTKSAAEVFGVIKSHGETLVDEIGNALRISIQAAQQRLNELVKLNVVERLRVGKAYIYQIPRIEPRALTNA